MFNPESRCRDEGGRTVFGEEYRIGNPTEPGVDVGFNFTDWSRDYGR